ncbi:MAG TPA: metallophosphoesterase [Nitrososphaeraceae archaeon]|nr:metallophosphoesterase [Nitrososphaeraceae archaeon]
MRLGIISDTHDDVENVRAAIDIFNQKEVETVIHAGDYIFPGIVKEFGRLNAKLVGVLGNNDGEKGHLLKNFLDVGGALKGELGELQIEDLKIGIYHGTSEAIKDLLVKSGNYNILVCGHTHKREPSGISKGKYQNDGGTLVLNPGTAHRKVDSLSGAFLEGGVIILDTKSKEYFNIDLP